MNNDDAQINFDVSRIISTKVSKQRLNTLFSLCMILSMKLRYTMTMTLADKKCIVKFDSQIPIINIVKQDVFKLFNKLSST